MARRLGDLAWYLTWLLIGWWAFDTITHVVAWPHRLTRWLHRVR